MTTPFSVVCLKWGDKYPAEYVNKLYRMVQRHTTVPHRFVCFTDDTAGIDDEIETKQLLSKNLEGWWNKLSLFKEVVSDLRGQLLFLDLDIVITGNIDWLFSAKPSDTFLSVADFLFPDKTFNSSVFRLEVGKHTIVWKQLVNVRRREDGMYEGFGRTFHGDQDFITYVLFPNGEHLKHCYDNDNRIVSYKKRVMNAGGPSPETSIVVFHGNPNPHEVEDGWVKKYWN